MKKMFLLLLIAGICFSMDTSLAATPISGNVEVREVTTDKNFSQLNFYGSILNDTFGISGFFSISEKYSEAYVGPIWVPAPWISLEASVGLQQVKDGSPLRYAVAGWMGNEIGSLYYIKEMGADSEDWWEKFRVFANLPEKIKLGTIYEKDRDWGPIIEIPIPSSFKVQVIWYPEPSIAQVSLFFCF